MNRKKIPKIILLSVFVVVIILAVLVSSNKLFVHSRQVTLVTNYGDIVFETYDEEAPNTVNNFVNLAQKGFYDGLIFHRVVKNFMIQGGDPYCTNNQGVCGTGGPGYKFADEIDENSLSVKAGYLRGVVAMANSGPNTNGSQFFIIHHDMPLPHDYTIFGKVTKGMDVVDKIANVPTGKNSKPLDQVVIKSVIIESDAK